MATIRQKRLANHIIKNASAKTQLNKKELLVSAGYDETTAMATPNKIIMQKGVQKELIIKGFTEERAKEVVAEILEKGEEGNRLRAAKEIFLVSGSYAPEKRISASVDINELQAQITKQIDLFQGRNLGLVEPYKE